MRFLLSAIFVSLLVAPAVGQEVGDTVEVRGEHIRAAPSMNAKEVGFAENGSRGVITDVGPQEEYVQIDFDDQQGWVFSESLVPEEEVRMCRRGYTVALTGQTAGRDAGDGIWIELSVRNISRSKTVKYVRATWQLYNPVGDPAQKDIESSTQQTRIVGPLKPGQEGSGEFEDVWYSSVGSCVLLDKLVVTYMDGSRNTYTDDLKNLAQDADSVRLEGDCSYEAQQERQLSLEDVVSPDSN